MLRSSVLRAGVAALSSSALRIAPKQLCRPLAAQLCLRHVAMPTPMHSRALHAHPDVTAVSSPDQALDFLMEGNKRFVSGDVIAPNRSVERMKHVATGQKPFAAVLSCADSRVPVEILFDQGFGDVFVTRVAGNVVTTEITASLEFGTAVLGAKLLLVLGHSSCGAVSASISGAAVPGVISSLYYQIHPACVAAKHTSGPGTHLEKSIEENVRMQARQLAISPVLSELVENGDLKIVGGVYDLESGAVNIVTP